MALTLGINEENATLDSKNTLKLFHNHFQLKKNSKIRYLVENEKNLISIIEPIIRILYFLFFFDLLVLEKVLIFLLRNKDSS